MTVEQKAKRFCKNFVFTYTIPSYNETKRKSGALIAEESFIAGYNECEKEHEWHDLRKDPNDLPKDKHNVWCIDFDIQGEGWYDKDTGYWTLIYRDYHTHCIKAWCELPKWKEIE